MTREDALEQMEAIIDKQWRGYLQEFEERLRADGLNEDDIAAVMADCRLDWYEQKTRQLRETSDELFAKLHTERFTFTSEELKIISDRATPLAPRDRGEFLREVAIELENHEHLGPGLVSRICARLQRRFVSQRATSGSQ